MYCARCGMYHFGGSRCPSCGDGMVHGGMKFTRTGEPLARGAEADPAAAPFIRQAGAGGGKKEAGKSEGFPVRLAYKLMESVFACALFTVFLRMAIFLVKVAESLMETGGDVKEGISLITEVQRAIEWYEIGGWVLLTVLIFKFRRNPR
ncbi:MAG: hypothetical protein WCP22_08360 [Chlamydiota bacterium]